ncbi:MAG: hypothetical protein O2931_09410 [Planctomycetota bacterium]|nr:hypothetical protein [Planctomycetota bacterium]MDA1178999.1 hypothetical protein [Planctomycetota bacterium]
MGQSVRTLYVSGLVGALLALASGVAKCEPPRDSDPELRDRVPELAELADKPASSEQAAAPWAELLRSAWDTSPSAKAALDEMYAKYAESSRSRALGDAYLIALVKQRRYDEALQWLGKPSDVHPHDILRGRTHVWILAATRKYEPAQVRLAELLAALPTDPIDTWSPAERGLLLFAGRLTGYLLGPAATDASQRMYDQTLAPTVTNLPADAKAQFDLARQSVLDQYEELRKQVEDLRQLERQRQEESKAQEKERIEKQTVALQQRQADLDRQRDELRNSLREQLQSLAERDTEVAARLSQLGMTAEMLFDSVVRSEWGIQNLIDLYENTEDDGLAFWWLRQIDSLDIRQVRDLRTLRDVERVAAATQAQRIQTQREASQVSQDARNQVQELEQERGRMVRWQKQLEKEQRKLDRTTASVSRELRVKQQQLKAIQTYEPYPLEVLRGFVLKRTN